MSGTHLLLVYLPMMQELKSRKVIASHRDLLLMHSMEGMLHTRFRLVQQQYDGELPAKIDLQPYDWHPNRRGLELYAAMVARMAAQELPSRWPAQMKSPSAVHAAIPCSSAKNAQHRGLAGGGGGIRTHERLSPLPVFKTGAFNRSATPPRRVLPDLQYF